MAHSASRGTARRQARTRVKRDRAASLRRHQVHVGVSGQVRGATVVDKEPTLKAVAGPSLTWATDVEKKQAAAPASGHLQTMSKAKEGVLIGDEHPAYSQIEGTKGGLVGDRHPGYSQAEDTKDVKKDDVREDDVVEFCGPQAVAKHQNVSIGAIGLVKKCHDDGTIQVQWNLGQCFTTNVQKEWLKKAPTPILVPAQAVGISAAAVAPGGSAVAPVKSLSTEEAILAKLALGFDMEDALDSQGVSNELLIMWAKRDDKMNNVPGASGDGRCLVTGKTYDEVAQGATMKAIWGLREKQYMQVRDACLRFMSHLSQVLSLQQKSWFEAVVLFDVYCRRRKPLGTDLEHVPSLCVALVKLLKKTDSAKICLQGSNFSAYTSHLAQWLKSQGFNASEGSEETIFMQEQNVLEALGWQVNLPSIESWLSMFCARFNLLTRGVFVQSLNWVWQQSLSYARWLVLRQASCPTVPVRRLARGLVSIMLVSVRLVPLESLRPPQLCAAAWERLFAESHPQNIVPQCALRQAHVDRLLQILEIAMGADLASLQKDSEFVATLSRDMLAELAQQGNNSPFGIACGSGGAPPGPVPPPGADGQPPFQAPVIGGSEVLAESVPIAGPAAAMGAVESAPPYMAAPESAPPPYMDQAQGQVHYASC